MNLNLTVNGKRRRVPIEPHRTLLELLREDLGLTGTKHGCESGECGACTVLIDGEPAYACLTLAARIGGRKVTTIEGVPEGHALVQAFADAGAVQCGYCTPGMILSAKAHLERKGHRCGGGGSCAKEALSGNACRCTGYWRIVEAVGAAARKLRKAGAKTL